MEQDIKDGVPESKTLFNKIVLDLLIENSSRQLAFNQFYLGQLSKQTNIDLDYFLKILEKETEKARVSIAKAIYAEYGEFSAEIKEMLRGKDENY